VPPSCAVIVSEPEQLARDSVLPFSRLRNTILPDARHQPVNEGKPWAG